MPQPDVREVDLERLRAVFRRFPEVRRVLIFGSRGTGTAKRASDVVRLDTLPPGALAAAIRRDGMPIYGVAALGVTRSKRTPRPAISRHQAAAVGLLALHQFLSHPLDF